MPRAEPSRKRCAIYTRKSSEEGLEQEFNSLAAQREACEAYLNPRLERRDSASLAAK
jgi:site-specific DNA recombinase